MKYKFKKHNWDGDIVIGVESENKILNNIGSWGWTPQKVQEIILGVESSKNKPLKEEYIWANEDVTLYANKNGVLLVDMIAQRFGKDNPEEITLLLQHEEFINFLKDFKKFVSENS
jgi:hypothetical protein